MAQPQTSTQTKVATMNANDNSIEAGFKAIHAYMTATHPADYQITAEHSETEFHRGKWIVDIFNAAGDHLEQKIVALDMKNGMYMFETVASYVPAQRLQAGDITEDGTVTDVSPAYQISATAKVVSVYYGRQPAMSKYPNELVRVAKSWLFS